MKNPTEIKELRSKLNTSEIADLNWLKAELENFSETDNVSFDGITRIENILNTFNNFRANYTQRVLRLMRQGSILD
tara:strand:+ start:191 stop:418 length:228 start_codon:yes stop_codon:yes gene_type:complete